MRIIKPTTLRSYWQAHSKAKPALEQWLLIAQSAHWGSLQDVRKIFPHADAAKVESEATVTIFNIKGNNYRLITAIHYSTELIFIRDFLTHANYSKNLWKGNH